MSNIIQIDDLASILMRKRGNMNIRAAALEIGISPTTLLKIERGATPSMRTLRKLEQWLLGRTGYALLDLESPEAQARQEVRFSKHLAKQICEAAEKFRAVEARGHSS